VIPRSRLAWLPSLLLVFLQVAIGETDQAQNTDQAHNLGRQFQAALAQYDSGHFPEAARQLEALVQVAPESFDIHELLGMVYAAESDQLKANEHLLKAVRLKPDSAAAHTNLAGNLVHLGRPRRAEAEFKQAIELDPGSYDTNHNLGEFYVAGGKIQAAVPFLEKAQQANPSAYDNGYDLALAYSDIGRLADATNLVGQLLSQRNTAELHNLLGQIDEKDENFVAAENEYQAAAHMDPSESNLFDWGSELLVHRTLDPAVEVFRQASELYPNSPRLAIGLGMALYSRGNYDDAVKALLKAADLNPSDPRCYYFLSKAYHSSPTLADQVRERFRRFADLQPRDPHAFYYYAMSLWQGRRSEDSSQDAQIESLLKKSVALNPGFPDAHLELGNWYSDEKKYRPAIPEYEKALNLNPNLTDAHYRLGQALVHTGQRERAQQELEIYQKLRTEHLAEAEKERAEIRQFVVSEKEGGRQ
jgi:tetratricopeptide (TPR) repeat protein